MCAKTSTQSPAGEAVLFETRPCEGRSLGLITLNSPEKYNALTLPMVEAIQKQLDAWAEDDEIAIVVICGAGEKAFCAGADVRALHDVLQRQRGRPDNDAERFFAIEYRMDYTIHTYPKPVVCWGQGVVMGGGMGILSASRYRMVTPDLKLAMPEIRIGFFPDVGATHFLNRLPGSIGMFLGLTGASLNIADALRVGLADYAVPNDAFDEMLEWIQAEDWRYRVETNDRHLHETLHRYAAQYRLDLSDSHLEHHEQFISRVCRGSDVVSVVSEILEAKADTEWFKTAQTNLRDGCPVSAHLVFELLNRGLQQTLRDIFQMELNVAVHCMRHRDFMEGVRARLIDKDNKPRWTHRDVASVPKGWVKSHFSMPWGSGKHPLEGL